MVARRWSVSWRALTFAVLVLAYAYLTYTILVEPSWVLNLDSKVFYLDLNHRWPRPYLPIHIYVMLGQRGPTTLVAAPWFIWHCWKFRTVRPLVLLGTALLVLNLTVGVVKIATGRLGPVSTHQVDAIHQGGDIFPSGHTANAVVLYGVIAMIVVAHRKLMVAVAVFLSITVGLATVYLNTHWLSDVVGGWLAGGLVMLLLPVLMPYSERIVAAGLRVLHRYRERRHGGQLPPSVPAGAPVEVPVEAVLAARPSPVPTVPAVPAAPAVPAVAAVAKVDPPVTAPKRVKV